MSIEVELNGKTGKPCEAVRRGETRCPLRLHPASEDVIVGNVFGTLQHVRPHLWLGPMLNQALNTNRFRQVWYKKFTIKFWQRQPRYPEELLSFREGSTEPDIVIEWENPPTTVWIEAKWLSPMATSTANNPANDQIIRGVRTLLADTGWIQPNRLFQIPKRVPVWLALVNDSNDPVIDAYRNLSRLHEAIRAQTPAEWPPEPFFGAVTWMEHRRMLSDRLPEMGHTEQLLAGRVIEYLEFKLGL